MSFRKYPIEMIGNVLSTFACESSITSRIAEKSIDFCMIMGDLQRMVAVGDHG